MNQREYMRILIHLIPKKFMVYYNLYNKIYKNYIYFKIQKGMYGLLQAGKLANDLLWQRLAKHDYHKTSTSGLWKYTTQRVTFTLVVDDLV